MQGPSPSASKTKTTPMRRTAISIRTEPVSPSPSRRRTGSFRRKSAWSRIACRPMIASHRCSRPSSATMRIRSSSSSSTMTRRRDRAAAPSHTSYGQARASRARSAMFLQFPLRTARPRRPTTSRSIFGVRTIQRFPRRSSTLACSVRGLKSPTGPDAVNSALLRASLNLHAQETTSPPIA